MSREYRAESAKKTLKILQDRYYTNTKGELVDIETQLKSAVSRTVLIRPDDFTNIFARRDALLADKARVETSIEITAETTLQAAERLSAKYSRFFVLNFASAKNPGGGFLGGSQAQEESLARASALYACIEPQREYYTTNRNCGTCLYTDYMIYSPDVPVFCRDEGDLLDAPYTCSFLTAPAANAGAVGQKNIKQIEYTMRQRLEKLLSVAIIKDYKVLVLGAWGSGVFQNAPQDVAGYFRDALLENPVFKGAFERVVFAIYDNSKAKTTMKAFEKAFKLSVHDL